MLNIFCLLYFILKQFYCLIANNFPDQCDYVVYNKGIIVYLN